MLFSIQRCGRYIFSSSSTSASIRDRTAVSQSLRKYPLSRPFSSMRYSKRKFSSYSMPSIGKQWSDRPTYIDSEPYLDLYMHTDDHTPIYIYIYIYMLSSILFYSILFFISYIRRDLSSCWYIIVLLRLYESLSWFIFFGFFFLHFYYYFFVVVILFSPFNTITILRG